MEENLAEDRTEEQIKLPDGSNLIIKPMEDIMHSSMMSYAEYVILERALPRVEDGLKPVQRRILYSMYEMGLTPDKPFRKSAAIVGDCLGKFHPHGDSSVYDAMVRMAQNFNMRETLVEGQGNFGNIDGDNAAAMRYTEAKLTPSALELLRDIDKNTVEFVRNYDDRLQEPATLPGRFPNLLVNGASGIAVGLATNIPPHNLGEVIDGVIAYIDNRDINLKAMMKIIKGPDFPTGGFTIIGDELREAYATGRGKITMRAKIQIEILENEKKNIVITELPYQVNKSDLLKRILEVKDEKKELFSGISQIEDESDQSGMRAVIRVKRDSDPYQIVNALYKYTDLQKTFGVNIVAIADGRPQQMGLLDIIAYYTDYQRKVVLARTKFELQEASERAHILMGLVIAVKNIDEVIAIIKKSGSSNEAKQNLRQQFHLSDRQAQAILDLQLRRLTKLEIDKLVTELRELEERIKRLSAIVGSKKLLMDLIKEELTQIKKAYKNQRRTELVGNASEASIEVLSDEKPREEFAVGVTANDLFKRMALKHVSMSSRTFSEKTTPNDTYKILFKSRTGVMLHIFTSLGNCFKIDAFDIPDSRWRDKGASLKELFPEAAENEKVLLIEPVVEDYYPTNDLYFFTASGMVKRSNWSEYKLLKNVFQAVKMKDDDELVCVENDIEKNTILLITKGGMSLHFDKSDIPLQGRISGGVKGIQLADGDTVAYAGQVNPKSMLIAITEKGFYKLMPISEFGLLGRYRKGLKAFDLKNDVGLRIEFCTASDSLESIVMFTDGEPLLLETAAAEKSTRTGRASALKGKKKGVDIAFCSVHKSEVAMVDGQQQAD